MKLNELIGCSIPLLAEQAHNHDYPYWFGGTCFLLRHDGALYAVTASHCLRQKTKEQVRIQRRPNSKTFLTLTALFVQDERLQHEDDPDHDDWAVFQVLEPEHDPADSVVPILDLDAIPDAQLPPRREHNTRCSRLPNCAVWN